MAGAQHYLAETDMAPQVSVGVLDGIGHDDREQNECGSVAE
jgi:hypothetical protein